MLFYSLRYVLTDVHSMTYQNYVDRVFVLSHRKISCIHHIHAQSGMDWKMHLIPRIEEEKKPKGWLQPQSHFDTANEESGNGSGFIRWLQASWQSARWAGLTNGHWFFNKGPTSFKPTVPHRYPSCFGYLTTGSCWHPHTAHLLPIFILTVK